MPIWVAIFSDYIGEDSPPGPRERGVIKADTIEEARRIMGEHSPWWEGATVYRADFLDENDFPAGYTAQQL
jgi:hypothetical protein